MRIKTNITRKYNTPYQLKLPPEIEKIIEISYAVYTFCEVMENIDLRKYLAVKESRTGRKRYSPEILLKIILFAFMESIHNEVLNNLNSTHGALLRKNRSIQAEGAYGTIKWNRAYTRAGRKGIKGLNLEIAIISCGFNLHKYHLKQAVKQVVA